MRSMPKIIASLAASTGLLMSSTAAVASAPAPAQPGAWMMLSMLTPSGATALGGATVAAQPVEVPPAQPSRAAGGGFVTPPIPVLLVWLAVIGVDVYLLTKEHNHPVPNSPG